VGAAEAQRGCSVENMGGNVVGEGDSVMVVEDSVVVVKGSVVVDDSVEGLWVVSLVVIGTP